MALLSGICLNLSSNENSSTRERQVSSLTYNSSGSSGGGSWCYHCNRRNHFLFLSFSLSKFVCLFVLSLETHLCSHPKNDPPTSQQTSTSLVT